MEASFKKDFKLIRGRNRNTRFPGICEHARKLGVSRVHLWYVLTGERKSPRIEQYFAKLGHRAGRGRG
ncbi:MAG TPA: hypothetical protein PKE55_11375 [Kiritimatiellia bacterium]|nr:hypothetical protein [Kiritimatiellia bacterium]